MDEKDLNDYLLSFCRRMWHKGGKKLSFVHIQTRDMYDDLINGSVSDLLYPDEESMGYARYNERYGIADYRKQDLERGITYLTCYWWNWDDETELWEMDITAPFYDGGEDYVGNERISLYNGNTVSRTISLIQYFETGYEGHHHKVRSPELDDLRWFATIANEIDDVVYRRKDGV